MDSSSILFPKKSAVEDDQEADGASSRCYPEDRNHSPPGEAGRVNRAGDHVKFSGISGSTVTPGTISWDGPSGCGISATSCTSTRMSSAKEVERPANRPRSRQSSDLAILGRGIPMTTELTRRAMLAGSVARTGAAGLVGAPANPAVRPKYFPHACEKRLPVQPQRPLQLARRIVRVLQADDARVRVRQRRSRPVQHVEEIHVQTQLEAVVDRDHFE